MSLLVLLGTAAVIGVVYAAQQKKKTEVTVQQPEEAELPQQQTTRETFTQQQEAQVNTTTTQTQQLNDARAQVNQLLNQNISASTATNFDSSVTYGQIFNDMQLGSLYTKDDAQYAQLVQLGYIGGGEQQRETFDGKADAAASSVSGSGGGHGSDVYSSAVAPFTPAP